MEIAYARIQNGVVAELFTTDGDIADMFHPELVWIDCSSVDGIAVGWAYDGTAFMAPPPPAPPSLAQQAQSALSVGCQIVSTAAPALDGTYTCDMPAQARLTAIQTRINAGLGLPLGLSTIDWIDSAGAPHSFTAEQFTALAHALSDYVYQLDMLVFGQGAALPTQPVTIA